MRTDNNACSLDWLSVNAVLLDVDGTLYDQVRLRRKMFRAILGSLILRRISYAEVRALNIFRSNREWLADTGQTGVSIKQFEPWPKDHHLEPDALREVVRIWMMECPLKYLDACRFPGVLEFVQALQRFDIKVAIVSDYPADRKTAALGINVPISFSATDADIDEFKPSPKSFLAASRSLGIPPSQCLVIGDRLERDGWAATAAGMRYLLKHRRARSDSYFNSFNELTQIMVRRRGSGPLRQ